MLLMILKIIIGHKQNIICFSNIIIVHKIIFYFQKAKKQIFINDLFSFKHFQSKNDGTETFKQLVDEIIVI